MEMHQIRYFLEVGRLLNFTHAADKCNVAQPSLSRAIQKLEAELGGELFRRERGLTHLTDLGKLMIPPLTRCLENAAEAKELAAKYHKGDSAPLRIAVSNSIDLELLQSPLSQLVGAFSGLELQLLRGSAAEVELLLKSGDAELALACPIKESWERLESWKLFDEGFLLVAHLAQPVAKQNAVTLKQIGEMRLVARPYCEQVDALTDLLRENKIGQDSADTVASDQDLVALLSTGIGVSIMPASVRLSNGLRAIRVHDLNLTRPVTLYAISGRRRSPAAAALIRLLRAADWKKTAERVCKSALN